MGIRGFRIRGPYSGPTVSIFEIPSPAGVDATGIFSDPGRLFVAGCRVCSLPVGMGCPALV